MNTVHLKPLLKGLAQEPIPDIAVTGVQDDSRKIIAGDLFLAYPGLRTDGRRYFHDAVEKKAAAIVCEAEHYQPTVQTTIPIIPIAKLQHCIGEIAARFYGNPSEKMNIIGVTGTNGKTSCTQFIAQALQSQNIPCGVVGTLGYGFLPDLQKTDYTTPDPIQLQRAFADMHAQGAKAIAMEVSSHALDQHRVQGVHFTAAVLTQLSRDHLDYHKSMENYARAKELLFQQPGLRCGVVNADDALGRKIIHDYRDKLSLVAYSTTERSNDVPSVSAKKISSMPNGFRVEVSTPWGEGELTTTLLGRFNISNLLAVLSVLGLLNVPLSAALSELSQLTTVKGRMQCFGGADKPLVVVDYAHTPDALEKALTALREHCHGKLIGVIGCGGDRDKGKRPQMAAIAERFADHVILTNDNPRSEPPMNIIRDMQVGLKRVASVTVELDRDSAIQYAVQKAVIGDIVLIAGKGHETTQVVGDKITPFDDAIVVKRSLDKWTRK